MGDPELPIIRDIWTCMGYWEGMGGSRKIGPAVKELMACLIQLPGQGLKLAVVGMGMNSDGLLQPSRAPSLTTPSRLGGHGSEARSGARRLEVCVPLTSHLGRLLDPRGLGVPSGSTVALMYNMVLMFL